MCQIMESTQSLFEEEEAVENTIATKASGSAEYHTRKEEQDILGNNGSSRLGPTFGKEKAAEEG